MRDDLKDQKKAVTGLQRAKEKFEEVQKALETFKLVYLSHEHDDDSSDEELKKKRPCKKISRQLTSIKKIVTQLEVPKATRTGQEEEKENPTQSSGLTISIQESKPKKHKKKRKK